MKQTTISSRINFALLGSLILLFGCLPGPVFADQNDPRLDELFTRLQSVEDQTTGDEITDQIWTIWREYPNQEINDLMTTGIRSMSAGRLRQAERIFDEVISKAPDFAEGWNKRATVLYFLKQFDKSAADVRQTLLLEPRHFGATAGLGLIFLSLNYPKSALEAFQKALEINPHLTGPKMQVERLQEYLRDDPV